MRLNIAILFLICVNYVVSVTFKMMSFGDVGTKIHETATIYFSYKKDYIAPVLK
jgi:hypothetical protein